MYDFKTELRKILIELDSLGVQKATLENISETVYGAYISGGKDTLQFLKNQEKKI